MSVRHDLSIGLVALAGLLMAAPARSISPDQCTGGCRGDINNDGYVTIDDIIQVVDSALNGCDCVNVVGTWTGAEGNTDINGFSLRVTTQKGCAIEGVMTFTSGSDAGHTYRINKGTVTGSSIVFELEVDGFGRCISEECTQRWPGTVASDGNSMGGRLDIAGCGDVFPWHATRQH